MFDRNIQSITLRKSVKNLNVTTAAPASPKKAPLVVDFKHKDYYNEIFHDISYFNPLLFFKVLVIQNVAIFLLSLTTFGHVFL